MRVKTAARPWTPPLVCSRDSGSAGCPWCCFSWRRFRSYSAGTIRTTACTGVVDRTTRCAAALRCDRSLHESSPAAHSAPSFKRRKKKHTTFSRSSSPRVSVSNKTKQICHFFLSLCPHARVKIAPEEGWLLLGVGGPQRRRNQSVCVFDMVILAR